MPLRIIAGLRRGHKLEGPPGERTKPTSDFVRESIFNILRDEVDDRPVIDLFAGTGALGLEALSRGARSATFVEKRRENLGVIRRNLATLRFEDRGSIVAADAYKWIRDFEPNDLEPIVVFLDPPYVEYDRNSKRIRELLADLVARLPEGSVLVVESGRPFGPDVVADIEAWDQRRYGDTYVAFRTIERTNECGFNRP